MSRTTLKYRKEIDGLRAVAVIPVILFHGDFHLFKGGFVGVDVFFVISGYLITTIILAEIEQDNFSLLNFYERRIRRILPALYLVMFVSIPLAWLWLLPAEMKSFSQSLAAVSVFSSNFLFWQETGYWGAENDLKPLLHTWSLAVEEQYYVLFPLFLVFMWRFRKRWILGSFLVTAAASLFLSQWLANHYPTANFFLLPTRAWELAIGAIIAFYFLYRKQNLREPTFQGHIDETLSLLGLLMIGFAVFRFDESVPFPSFYALVPTVGAGLIIVFTSSQTLVGRLLSNKLLVGIGLISYSAYLWHHMLFAFARQKTLTEPSATHYGALAMLAIILAWLSWKYIEQPFRKRKRFRSRTIFTFGIVGSASFILIGLAGHVTDGFSGRGKFPLHSVDEKLKINYGLNHDCSNAADLPIDCRTTDEPEILVWGDSFAMHLVQGIIASNPDARIIQFTKSVCGPFFDIAPIIEPTYPIGWSQECLKFTGQVREWLNENTSIRYAVLSSPFKHYLSPESDILHRNWGRKSVDTGLIIEELLNTLQELRDLGITPVVFSPPPKNGTDLTRCLVRAKWLGLDLDQCNFQVVSISKDTADVYAMLEVVNEKTPVIRLDRIICDNDVCRTHVGEQFIFRDKAGHLSIEGSTELGRVANFYGLITDGLSK